MSDGITKGIGEQMGQLGKHVVTEVAKVPAKITGGWEIPAETVGGGQKGKGQTQGQKPAQQAVKSREINVLDAIRQQDEAEKKAKLEAARRMLQQFIKPGENQEPDEYEKRKMEEMEKKKQEIEEEKKRAQAALQQPATKRPKGDLYGVKAKQMGAEVGKNVKAG